MSRRPFDYSLDYANINFRDHPELYRFGKGEQGVLLVQPYKDEILPYWRFKTIAEAKKSSAKIYKLFLAYLKANDFRGADMARKFLQMGWTRARHMRRRTAAAPQGRREGGSSSDLLREICCCSPACPVRPAQERAPGPIRRNLC